MPTECCRARFLSTKKIDENVEHNGGFQGLLGYICLGSHEHLNGWYGRYCGRD
jgi:hypothetical protein